MVLKMYKGEYPSAKNIWKKRNNINSNNNNYNINANFSRCNNINDTYRWSTICKNIVGQYNNGVLEDGEEVNKIIKQLNSEENIEEAETGLDTIGSQVKYS